MAVPITRKKRCKTWRCPNLHTNRSGYCDACYAKWKAKHPEILTEEQKAKRNESAHRYDERRGSASKRGYDARWTKFSKEFLKKNPTCAICGRPAQVTDHKTIPAEVMMDAWGSFDYDEKNYQPLCIRCNNRKGLTDDEKAKLEYFDMKMRLQGSDVSD